MSPPTSNLFGPGDPAPDSPLLNLDGRIQMLSTRWERGPAVLVFLRYFGCPLCRQRVVTLRGDRERFEQVGAQVVLIGQGKPEDGRRFAEARAAPFPLLVDPTRSAYDAYGLVRESVAQVFGPQCVIPMVRAAAQPESRQGLPNGGQLMQMPGTFVVDAGGVVRLAHRSATIADDPTTADLIRAIAAIQRAA